MQPSPQSAVRHCVPLDTLSSAPLLCLRHPKLLETVDHAYSYLHQAYVGHRITDVLNKFSIHDIIRQVWYCID